MGFLLTGLETIFAHDDAVVFFVYLAVLTVAGLRRYAAPVIAAMAVFTLLAPRVIPGWGDQLDYSGALAVVLVGLAMYGFFAVIQSNIELAAARARSPGWPPRTSAAASPATCTTCSGTRSPRSR